jgi:hypothetical protein
MPNMVVPASSQRMFNTVDVVLANYAMGRLDNPFAGFAPTIYPGKYVLASPEPRPFKDTGGSSFSGAVAASALEPDVGPKSSLQARSIWPNLR